MVSPSRTPESPAGGQAFWDSFPSSPTKLSASSTPVSTAPFPNLTTLQLASNPLASNSLLAPGFDLPPKLQVLDLSDTKLGEKGLPLRVLGRLDALRELQLDGCGVGEGLFAEDEAPAEEQLKTVTNPFTSRPSPPPFPTSNGTRRSPSSDVDEAQRYFPSLTLLSLANNALDEVFPLEQFLNTRLRRPIEWIGLEKPILNLMHAEMVQRRKDGEEGPGNVRLGLRVDVRDNAMRWERERRRERLRTRESEKERRSVEHGEEEKGSEGERSADVRDEGMGGDSAPTTNGHADEEELERQLDTLALEDGGASEDSPSSPTVDTPPATEPASGTEPSSSPPTTPTATTAEPAQVHSPSESASAPEALATDSSVILVSSSITSGSTALTLSSRSLTSLPTPSTGAPPSSLRSFASVDLSLNHLEAVPLQALQTWTWARGLVKLDLRRNRVRGVDFGAFRRGEGGEALLPNLKTLDLSWNQLESTTTTLLGSPTTDEGLPTPTLSLLAALAPSLTTLDLSHNHLTTLRGVSSLVRSSPSSSGVRTLLLKGNRIEDLEELCEVARELGEQSGGGWATEELDLSDNEIARVGSDLPRAGFKPR